MAESLKGTFLLRKLQFSGSVHSRGSCTQPILRGLGKLLYLLKCCPSSKTKIFFFYLDVIDKFFFPSTNVQKLFPFFQREVFRNWGRSKTGSRTDTNTLPRRVSPTRERWLDGSGTFLSREADT